MKVYRSQWVLDYACGLLGCNNPLTLQELRDKLSSAGTCLAAAAIEPAATLISEKRLAWSWVSSRTTEARSSLSPSWSSEDLIIKKVSC